MYIFEISTKRQILWCPIRPIQRKNFSSLRRDNELFWELKRSKMEENAQNFEKRFIINYLRFSLPFQNFMSHIEIMKFCQNHWSPMPIVHLQRTPSRKREYCYRWTNGCRNRCWQFMTIITVLYLHLLFLKGIFLALRMFFVPLQQREKAVLIKDIFLNIWHWWGSCDMILNEKISEAQETLVISIWSGQLGLKIARQPLIPPPPISPSSHRGTGIFAFLSFYAFNFCLLKF